MSRTFGQLRAGDEVCIINGNSVDIVKVESVVVGARQHVLITIEDTEYSLPVDLPSFYDDWVGDIQCDIDDAIKIMKERCENALHDYKRASGSMNLLETKKKEDEKRGNKKDNNV